MRHWTLVFAVSLLAVVWLGTGQTAAQAAVLSPTGGYDCSAASEILLSECEALVALYNNTDGPNWLNNSGWLQTNAPCDWIGVDCIEGSVTRLELPLNQLSGSIPPELGNLTKVGFLFLPSNQLSGSIPPELGNLTEVRFLSLGGNQLSGNIPPGLGNLTKVEYLVLDHNQLSGSIPPELGNLTKVQNLYLDFNQLTGSIPPELGNLTSVQKLYLSANQLSGSIPAELGNLTYLQTLSLFNNQLSGSIPPELGNITHLQALYLSVNQLSGSIPSELGNLANLENFGVRYNQLSGSIPPELSNLTNLSVLSLGYNMLWAENEAAQGWADQFEPDWESNQTVPPTEVAAAALDTTTIQVSWTPISYTQDTGHYEVSYALTSGGPYTVAGTTSSKSESGFALSNLQSGTTYYIVVRSFTAAHDPQQSNLLSPPSVEVSAAPEGQPTAVQLTAWTVRPESIPLSQLGGWAAGLGMVVGLWGYRRRR